MAFKDYYKILGFDNNKVDMQEIKLAYRDKAKQYHPDKNKEDNAEIFKDISEAYRILSDAKLRRKYDFSWTRNYLNQLRDTNKSFKDLLLEIFFGINKKEQNKKISKNGEDIYLTIDLTIEEAFFGVGRQLRFKDSSVERRIMIPAKIKQGDKIEVVGLGKNGENGGKDGNLIIKINIVNDENIKLENENIIYNVDIYDYEVVLGGKKKIILFNEEIEFDIPDALKINEPVEIKEKGYFKLDNSRGNLYIKLNVIFNTNIDEKTKKLYEKIKKMNVE